MAFDKTITSKVGYLDLQLKELVEFRDMLLFLVIRDFKIRFKQSLLGFMWAFVQPLIHLVVFSVIFGAYLDVEFEGPYPLFCLSGLIVWNYFAKVFANSTLSVVLEAELLKKVYFPRLILPLSQSISHFIDLFIALLILFGLMVWYGWPPGSQILLLPLWLFLNASFAVALSFWLAPINVRFRDIQIALPLLIQTMMFLSPVIYPAPMEKMGGIFKTLYFLNPMAGIIQGVRHAILGHGTLDWQMTLLPALMIAVLFLSGLAFFQRQQYQFADTI